MSAAAARAAASAKPDAPNAAAADPSAPSAGASSAGDAEHASSTSTPSTAAPSTSTAAGEGATSGGGSAGGSSSSSSSSSTGTPVVLDTEADAKFISFTIKYSKLVLNCRLSEDDDVADLKAVLFSLTDVPADRQKLLGLVKGALPPDQVSLGSITIPPSSLKGRNEHGDRNVHIMLLGTPLEATFKDPSSLATFAEDLSENTEDVDFSSPSSRQQGLEPAKDPANHKKLNKVIKRFSNFSVINEPRPGKRLLVLDLDYTLADTKRLLDTNSYALDAARPGLHEFLAAVYPDYDIVIWSQTSWRWLEVKLVELQMLADPRFKISFVLDRTPMFHIRSSTKGKEKERGPHCKPLELIWRRWPDIYGPHNTIHIDDLSRNFAMNPGNGLKIKAYRNSPSMDTELPALTRYLLRLSRSRSRLDQGHSSWKELSGPDHAT
ncbi:hypothetical protein OC835_003322 [Tilletia horrida]|uniref:FCP1 homology domain-containing protein n=1 Tax=Tilletia horrida TaxID=155126 RepID=A0AAN6JMU4_9BASI|nr:hypothetical protein OC835_003322 [Tilletia horrida]KAK0538935.1 hypothetical protein OC842_001132 [Tilletia horrida]